MRPITGIILRSVLVAVMAAAAAITAWAATPTTSGSDSTLVKSGYVSVSGLKMYYEIHGQAAQGAPLVLLHGGFMTIPAWGPTLPLLAQSRQVVAFELEGHGRTADLDRPLTVEQMAEDVAAGLVQLGIHQADFLGYSLGGQVALRIAVKHPELVRKLVLVSTTYSQDGWYPSISGSWPSMNAQAMKGTPMEQLYAQVAPDPTRWAGFVDKMRASLTGFKGWPESDIRSIKAPALIIFGDNDAVRPEYEIQMYRLLGGDKAQGGMFGGPASQLAVLPNTTHFVIFMRGDLLAPLVNPFLDAPTPASK